MKKIFYILVFLFSNSFSSQLLSNETYKQDIFNDCVLDHMIGIGSDLAANAILNACTDRSLRLKTSICVDTDAQNRNGIYYLPNETDPFTGSNVCKFDDGQLRSKGEIKDGEKNGRWITWFSNGQVSNEGVFIDNNKNGQWIWWNLDGIIFSKTKYIDDICVSGDC